MKQFIRNNSLSLVLFALFLVFLSSLSVSGHLHENEVLTAHGEATVTYGQYLMSGSFLEAVFENWESEFLQMGALVVFTIWLYQRGSADSKKLRGKTPVDTSSRQTIIQAASWKKRAKGIKELLYANSLSIALFGLFILSFVAHALSGTAAANEEALLHSQPQLSVLTYIRSSQFWFESFQNWQSEFLAVGVLLVLSIFLRQRGSPESKSTGEPNTKTGS